jgi:uncharacterized membrane protein
MTRVEIKITIYRPAQEVFDYLANFENNPQWQAGMQSAHFTSEGDLRVGTTYAQVASFLGRRIETNFEVIEYEAGQRVKIKSTSGSFPIQVLRAVTASEDGAQVHAVIEGDAGGFFKIFAPLLNWMVRRQICGDYANLKRILEGNTHP